MKARKISSNAVALSVPSLEAFLFSFKDSIGQIANNFISSTEGSSRLNRNSFGGKFKKFLPLVLLLIIVVVVILVVKGALQRAFSQNTSRVAGSTDFRVDIAGPKAKVDLNSQFSFPIKDDKGKEVVRLKYTLVSAELRDEIIVKGQRATAVKGRTYLILTIDLTNRSNKGISFNTLNYVRLSMNGNRNKWIAADIHNDPVLVQAISTKTTRLGFPINDTDKDLVLQVGEVDGTKQTVPLKF